ncbi:MAG TPA: hypothetical protein GXX20_00060 [Clostridiaceae bacterium]|nr:hypothetical protein [Clostridiaceae bacterium]
MSDYKNSKWASEILKLQNEEGSWGYFHTLGKQGKTPITTEQALRRLLILGYNINDEPIQRCVSYMNDCLLGKKQIPDRREKLHDWDIITKLILSTWIRKFTKDCYAANKIADIWTDIISYAFVDEVYNHDKYVEAYENAFGIKPKGGRLVDFVNFYQISLISDCLDERTESVVIDYILSHNSGIYYIYESRLSVLPETFEGKKASRYIGAIELLAEYKKSRSKLNFVIKWLNENKNENGKWDMGKTANDKIYFPLSNSWRQISTREADCTYRIEKLIRKISTG